jgi:hypothetical protein
MPLNFINIVRNYDLLDTIAANVGSAMSYSTDAKAVAEALVRLYGREGALTMASRYSADSAASGDFIGLNKWACAATWIADLIKTEELAKPKKT